MVDDNHVLGWRPIEGARKDRMIIGAYFNQRSCNAHREGRIVKCWWQPEFDAFISSCREMTMAPGYTIDGQSRRLHSPEIEEVTHYIDMPPPPTSEARS